jgi:hypothetical protein
MQPQRHVSSRLLAQPTQQRAVCAKNKEKAQVMVYTLNNKTATRGYCRYGRLILVWGGEWESNKSGVLKFSTDLKFETNRRDLPTTKL